MAWRRLPAFRGDMERRSAVNQIGYGSPERLLMRTYQNRTCSMLCSLSRTFPYGPRSHPKMVEALRGKTLELLVGLIRRPEASPAWVEPRG